MVLEANMHVSQLCGGVGETSELPERFLDILGVNCREPAMHN